MPGRAFEPIALQLAPGLYRTARRLTRRTDEALEVTRETVLRAAHAFDDSIDPAGTRAWLFGLLWEMLTELSAREPRDERVPETPPLDRMLAAVMEGAEADLDRVLLSRLDASPDVDVALRQLAPRDRFALLLVDIEELTYEEAARALSCPVEELALHLLTARSGLFTALFEYASRTSGVRTPTL
jgi:RNA polymerase sigma-70 factor (ECF subfamily)